MRRPGVLVLLLTFVALVVATTWVPCSSNGGLSGFAGADVVVIEKHDWRWVWQVYDGFDGRQWLTKSPGPGWFDGPRWASQLNAPMLALVYAVILAVGGLLALGLHTRERKRVAPRSPME